MTAVIGGTEATVWQGRQQDLFRKYAQKRSQAMNMIVHHLNELKEDLE